MKKKTTTHSQRSRWTSVRSTRYYKRDPIFSGDAWEHRLPRIVDSLQEMKSFHMLLPRCSKLAARVSSNTGSFQPASENAFSRIPQRNLRRVTSFEKSGVASPQIRFALCHRISMNERRKMLDIHSRSPLVELLECLEERIERYCCFVLPCRIQRSLSFFGCGSTYPRGAIYDSVSGS